jgi:hypothetical protein
MPILYMRKGNASVLFTTNRFQRIFETVCTQKKVEQFYRSEINDGRDRRMMPKTDA